MNREDYLTNIVMHDYVSDNIHAIYGDRRKDQNGNIVRPLDIFNASNVIVLRSDPNGAPPYLYYFVKVRNFDNISDFPELDYYLQVCPRARIADYGLIIDNKTDLIMARMILR